MQHIKSSMVTSNEAANYVIDSAVESSPTRNALQRILQDSPGPAWMIAGAVIYSVGAPWLLVQTQWGRSQSRWVIFGIAFAIGMVLVALIAVVSYWVHTWLHNMRIREKQRRTQWSPNSSAKNM